MSVISYYEASNGDHIEAGTGKVLSTREGRAKQDIPMWRRFESGRLEELDGETVSGPNATPRDIAIYGPYRHGGTLAPLLEIGELEERDGRLVCPVKIVVYPKGKDELVGRAWIAKGSHVSMSALEARELGQRHTETVTGANALTFVLSPSYKWAEMGDIKIHFYFRNHNEMFSKTDLITVSRKAPGGEQAPAPEPEPEQAPVADKLAGADLMAQLKEDGPETWVVDSPDNLPAWYWTLDKFPMNTGDQWGKVHIAYGHFVFYDGSGPRGRWSIDDENPPGPAPEIEPEPEKAAPARTTPDKILPDDDNHTPLEKALNWAAETHHGEAHQERWGRVAAALGADNGHDAMSYPELRKWWIKFNRNPRWSMALKALEDKS